MVKNSKGNLRSKKKSIYDELKSFYDENSGGLYKNQDLNSAGMKEYKVIANKECILKEYEKNIMANDLMLIILKEKKDELKISDLKEYLILNPIINYYDNFIKIYKDSNINDENLNDKNENIISKILLNNNCAEVVKFALILSPIINIENLEEILKVYSIHNEYIFYSLKAFEYIGGHNNDIFKIAKKSKRYGRVFSVMNLSPTTHEIKKWLVEVGGNDEVAVEVPELLGYCMLSIDLLDYLEHTEYKGEDVEKIATAFCILLSRYSIIDIRNGKKVCCKLLDMIDKGQGKLYSLFAAISMICSVEGMIINYYRNKNNSKMAYPEDEYEDMLDACDRILEKKIWHKVISVEILNKEHQPNVLITCAERTNYKLKKKEYEALLLSDCEDPSIYKYAFLSGNKAIRKCAIKIGLEKLPLDTMFSGQDEFTLETLPSNELSQICLYVILEYAQFEELEDRYKEINLQSLKSPLIEARAQAAQNLNNIREKINDLDKEIISEAITTEMSKNIRKRLNMLIDKSQGKQKKYVEIHENMYIDAHIKDINLITLNVAGTQYVDMSEVYNKLIEGEMVYLKRDYDNVYDDNTIEIITTDGYLIGYVPRENNQILKNLLDKGKYLYGLIEELNDDYSEISIKVYLSYRDVIEEITSTLSLLSGEREHYLQ